MQMNDVTKLCKKTFYLHNIGLSSYVVLFLSTVETGKICTHVETVLPGIYPEQGF